MLGGRWCRPCDYWGSAFGIARLRDQWQEIRGLAWRTGRVVMQKRILGRVQQAGGRTKDQGWACSSANTKRQRPAFGRVCWEPCRTAFEGERRPSGPHDLG